MKSLFIEFLKVMLLIVVTTVTVGLIVGFNLFPVPSDMVGLRMSVTWLMITWLVVAFIWAVLFSVYETIRDRRASKHVKNLSA